jgi:hypothetical protein
MGIMGVGGLIALAGGLIFVTISTRRLLGYPASGPRHSGASGQTDFVAESGA